jgi:hypothetical protein
MFPNRFKPSSLHDSGIANPATVNAGSPVGATASLPIPGPDAAESLPAAHHTDPATEVSPMAPERSNRRHRPLPDTEACGLLPNRNVRLADNTGGITSTRFMAPDYYGKYNLHQKFNKILKYWKD